ncbi:unnamed protein product, partial [Ectocarpus sp. 8 AP-2014]
GGDWRHKDCQVFATVWRARRATFGTRHRVPSKRRGGRGGRMMTRVRRGGSSWRWLFPRRHTESPMALKQIFVKCFACDPGARDAIDREHMDQKGAWLTFTA